ncbi:SDR family NAD(P)-dependent oxidoreductase [Parvibaculaceae bacterium PLY_AMNH_Bact1]|nr:SDR family NAD(P)-dependent oxidoreductase [Parvibaculaceae bacterium PLY_AMNH_Bact1]
MTAENAVQGLSIIIGVGASNGVGGALVHRFAKSGGPILVVGRTAEKIEAVAEEVRANGGTAHTQVCDVTSPDQVAALFDVAKEYGPLGSVLYNAGNNAIIPFEEVTPEQFEQFWRTGAYGAFLVAQQALKVMAAQGSGSFLVTGASASMRGKPNFAHFSSAKGALRNLTQSLARDYGPKGVHVGHVVIDGVVNGDMVRSRFADYLDAKGNNGALEPSAIAEAFWQLHVQHPSAWTHELDLRPFKEEW